jgi:hypothetical protein
MLQPFRFTAPKAQRFLRLRFLHPEMNPQGPPAILAPAVSPSPVSTVQHAQQDQLIEFLLMPMSFWLDLVCRLYGSPRADCIRCSSQLIARSPPSVIARMQVKANRRKCCSKFLCFEFLALGGALLESPCVIMPKMSLLYLRMSCGLCLASPG